MKAQQRDADNDRGAKVQTFKGNQCLRRKGGIDNKKDSTVMYSTSLCESVMAPIHKGY